MRAVIIGGADCVWDDLVRAEELTDFDALIAVNNAGFAYPGVVDVWASLHPEKWPEWIAKRAASGFLPARKYIAHEGHTLTSRPKAGVRIDRVTPYQWPGMSASGSSGLFAVKVALEEGFDRVVLCGVPMTQSAKHFDDLRPWMDVQSFTEAWTVALPFIRENVRSMSGWTREILGEPTPDWLL